MRVLALGIGDAFSARHYSACLAVEAEGAWLLVDCPHPIRKIVREASASAGIALDVDQFLAAAITHLHADHSSGLEGLGFYLRFRKGRRLPLLMHPEAGRRLWDGHLAAGMEQAILTPGGPPNHYRLDDFFDLCWLDEERPMQIGPFTIQCRPTLHSLPTAALRISAAGQTLGCSADTAFDPGLIDWLAAADRIIHECNPGPMHTPYAALAALPAAIRGKMLLIHCADDFDAAGSVIPVLEQGRLYEVGGPS